MAGAPSIKSYNQADKVLQLINKTFVSLNNDDKKNYMENYTAVLQELVKTMKEKDPLFKAIFQEIYWAGSYYDDLRVGKPDEYDLDVVMKLPIDYDTIEFDNKKVDPPFIKVKMATMDKLKLDPLWSTTYKQMHDWRDKDGFLLQQKFRIWMESVVNKALDVFREQNKPAELTINGSKYEVLLKKTGPAMTLTIKMPDGNALDVDFVPVLSFKSKWPPKPVRLNTTIRDVWYIVPKPNSKKDGEFKNEYWRMAFHQQEREMINDKGLLKPVCRLLKKFRDTETLYKNICSYYIKTLFLWELEKQNDDKFWNRGLTNIFMDMLKRLQESFKEGRINYFWDKRYDLTSGIQPSTKKDIAQRLARVIAEIEKKLGEGDPTVLAKYLLTKEERENEWSRVYHPVTPPPVQPLVDSVPETATAVCVANVENNGRTCSIF